MKLFLLEYSGGIGGALVVAEKESDAHQMLYQVQYDEALSWYNRNKPPYPFNPSLKMENGIYYEFGDAFIKVFECETDMDSGIIWSLYGFVG